MKYGRHQIDKAGEIILSSSKEEEVKEAMDKVNDWRTLHLTALDAFQKSIIPLLEKNKIKPVFISRRLKRLTSILYKLDINPQMKLGGMQDIGGLRIVLPDVDSLAIMQEVLKSNIPENFSFIKCMNYVNNPKESGYRSIHFIYKFMASNKDVDGMKIELQIRTKLQHNWAMAVETAGLITNTQLKSSQGANEWLNFFKIVSSLFAIKEKLPILLEHQNNNYNMENLMKILYNINKKHNYNDTLKALRVSTVEAKKNNFSNGYYILHINFETKKMLIYSFSKDKENTAMQRYSTLEKSAVDKTNAVVLVSVPKMKELQEAYPSYFLDTSDFLKAIDAMIKNCKKCNYV
ncbi:MAG: RelA/SpoT domain-containing protein [Prevotella sp.]|nr:RelA/SpoT domain-containing protein [Prevotella sp.]